jgi:hypothetical protein
MRFARAALLTHEGCTPKREASSSAVSRRAVSVLASDPSAVVVPTIALLSNGSAFSPHTNRSRPLIGLAAWTTKPPPSDAKPQRCGFGHRKFWFRLPLGCFCSVRHASA